MRIIRKFTQPLCYTKGFSNSMKSKSLIFLGGMIIILILSQYSENYLDKSLLYDIDILVTSNQNPELPSIDQWEGSILSPVNTLTRLGAPEAASPTDLRMGTTDKMRSQVVGGHRRSSWGGIHCTANDVVLTTTFKFKISFWKKRNAYITKSLTLWFLL